MAERVLQGWAGGGQTFGDRRVVITQHTGPASYTVITPGTAPAQPTGGDAISAKACGLSFIEAIFVAGDSSGKYSGYAFNPQPGTTGIGAAATSVPFQWIVSATGAEVTGTTNLSTFYLTLIVFGF
jgi:hypothetical protein